MGAFAVDQRDLGPDPGHHPAAQVREKSSVEDGGWLAFFRDLPGRGRSGVALVTSDATQVGRHHRGTLPGASWQRGRRLNKEIRRRTDVVCIFPGRTAISWLVAPCWPHDKTNGSKARATSALDVLTRARSTPTSPTEQEPATTPALTA